MLWKIWLEAAWPLQVAFSHWRTFYWFILLLIGFSVRSDQLGVTSFVRSLSLGETAYRRFLRLFRSRTINRLILVQVWAALARRLFATKLVSGDRHLHRESYNNRQNIRSTL